MAQPEQLGRQGHKAIRAPPVRQARPVQQVLLAPRVLLVRRAVVVHRLFPLSRWCGRLRRHPSRTRPTDRLVATPILRALESLKSGQVSGAPTTLTTVPCLTSFRLRLAAISLSETFRPVHCLKTFWSSRFPGTATASFPMGIKLWIARLRLSPWAQVFQMEIRSSLASCLRPQAYRDVQIGVVEQRAKE